MSAVSVSTRRTFQGAWECSAVVGGYIESRQFMGYTKRESVALFREYLRGVK